MKINKDCKTSIVRPSKDYISRVAGYISYHAKCMENLKKQLFPEENISTSSILSSILSTDAKARKSASNTEAQINLMLSVQHLPLVCINHVLVNPFSLKHTTQEQNHDLLQFRIIGQDEFEKHLSYYILKHASVGSTVLYGPSVLRAQSVLRDLARVTSRPCAYN